MEKAEHYFNDGKMNFKTCNLRNH